MKMSGWPCPDLCPGRRPRKDTVLGQTVCQAKREAGQPWRARTPNQRQLTGPGRKRRAGSWEGTELQANPSLCANLTPELLPPRVAPQGAPARPAAGLSPPQAWTSAQLWVPLGTAGGLQGNAQQHPDSAF